MGALNRLVEATLCIQDRDIIKAHGLVPASDIAYNVTTSIVIATLLATFAFVVATIYLLKSPSTTVTSVGAACQQIYGDTSMSRDEHKAYFDKAYCDAETARAIHIIGIGDNGNWIPKSVIDDDSEVYQKGDEGTLVLPEWFALKEGLI